ncbi:hypothetical protein [Phaeovulum sp.]|uniref:hypothetical protein n=1 Tax=Phaeovulum sp. TaxID=2934796 RepID=UPI0039E662AC
MGERLKDTCRRDARTFAAISEADAGVCRHNMRRRPSVGMFTAVECGKSLSFAIDAPVTHDPAFHSKRRSNPAWLLADDPISVVSIQAYENPSRCKIASQICIDRKPDNYALALKTATMTEAATYANFAPSTETDA